LHDFWGKDDRWFGNIVLTVKSYIFLEGYIVKRTKEVFAAVTAFSLLVLPAKMEAGNNEAAAIAAGVAIVALAVSQNQNGETKCTPTNWKNYVTGVKMTAAPATAIIDDKYTACEKKIFSFAATPEDTEAYRIDPFALKHVSGPDNNGLYYTVIASKSVDQASAVFGGGDKSENYTVWFDVNGTVKKADSPVSEMIGKKLFNIGATCKSPKTHRISVL
jgi:hypothetical protein